jgi:hypothetical protein
MISSLISDKNNATPTNLQVEFADYHSNSTLKENSATFTYLFLFETRFSFKLPEI